jgi:hypothetical protein
VPDHVCSKFDALRALTRCPDPPLAALSTPRARLYPGSLRRLLLIASWPLCFGCRCSSERSGPDLQLSALAEPFDCRRGSVQLTLEASGGRSGVSTSDPLEPGLELPFSTEPGMGLVMGEALFATGLRHEPRDSVALLARLGADALPSAVVELGHLRGDAPPPRLARDGSDLVVALEEVTTAGHDMRVARVRTAALDAPLDWRAGPHQARGESNVFDLAAHAGRALIVWDDWFAPANHGRVLIATLALDEPPAARVEGQPVSAAHVDAEAPRLSARPGGYWLAWLVNASHANAGQRFYDPGGGEQEDRTAQLSYGARWIELLPLDFEGHPAGEVRRLTPREERVVGYDLTTSPAGDAWVAWRQDASSPGASGGRVLVGELRLGGGVRVVPLRAEDVGAGEPSWLGSGDAQDPWLTFPDAQDRTVLLRVDQLPPNRGALRLPRDMESAAALAASGEKLLFASPRGRRLELFPASCSPPLHAAGRSLNDAGARRQPLPSLPDAAPPP